ncbi:hypothetical protein ASG37_16525 [Sphingomonas sp. Leaf407]|nr:hypothetical protein ASE97_16515 [Sphingomonas sp. Leaf42]KQT25036.1 hypothetical protein ASG37_16525 [Sphingomonas sp. Leaf407]
MSDTIVLERAGSWISGRGTLVAQAGLAGKPLLVIRTDDCIVEGIILENPDQLRTTAGEPTYGILIRGNRNRIEGCIVRDFQMCLATDATGEFYDNSFLSNHCRVLGAGDDSKGQGENRGDGITDWGARAKIIGNTIEAAPGRGGRNDCRIGIHVEGLGSYARNRGGADVDTGSEIIGNIVTPSPDGTGRFRRCYSIEGVAHARLIGNYGRGWTWNGVWLVGSSNGSIVSDNILHQDLRRPTDDGAAWKPLRAAILVYANDGVSLRDVQIRGNMIELANGSQDNGIRVQSARGRIENVMVAANTCTAIAAAGDDTSGILVVEVDDVQITGNRVKGGWNNGVRLLSSQHISIDGCTISGTRGFAIAAQATRIRLRITRNTIVDCGQGIEAVGNAGSVIDANQITGIKEYGMSFSAGDRSIVVGNIFQGNAGRVARFGDNPGLSFSANIGLTGL